MKRKPVSVIASGTAGSDGNGSIALDILRTQSGLDLTKVDLESIGQEPKETDVLILHVGEPQEAISALVLLAAAASHCPSIVIIPTATDEITDSIFTAGADDVLFEEEVSASLLRRRVRALTSRNSAASGEGLSSFDLKHTREQLASILRHANMGLAMIPLKNSS